MNWWPEHDLGEADAPMSRLSIYQDDSFGYLDSLFPPKSDRNGDGNQDGVDKCPDDPKKIVNGLCGCEKSDKDSDGDATPDCDDECNPANRKKGNGDAMFRMSIRTGTGLWTATKRICAIYHADFPRFGDD